MQRCGRDSTVPRPHGVATSIAIAAHGEFEGLCVAKLWRAPGAAWRFPPENHPERAATTMPVDVRPLATNLRRC
jgi:hypothetical protein